MATPFPRSLQSQQPFAHATWLQVYHKLKTTRPGQTLKCLYHEETTKTSNKDGHRSKLLSIQGLKYTIKETQQPNHMWNR